MASTTKLGRRQGRAPRRGVVAGRQFDVDGRGRSTALARKKKDTSHELSPLSGVGLPSSVGRGVSRPPAND